MGRFLFLFFLFFSRESKTVYNIIATAAAKSVYRTLCVCVQMAKRTRALQTPAKQHRVHSEREVRRQNRATERDDDDEKKRKKKGEKSGKK